MNLGRDGTVVLNEPAAAASLPMYYWAWLQGFRLLRLIAPPFNSRI
jgi:hypothetical protein